MLDSTGLSEDAAEAQIFTVLVHRDDESVQKDQLESDDGDANSTEIEVHVDKITDKTKPRNAQDFADTHTTRELKDLCKKYNLSSSGKKIDMASRIINSSSSADDNVVIVE